MLIEFFTFRFRIDRSGMKSVWRAEPLQGRDRDIFMGGPFRPLYEVPYVVWAGSPDHIGPAAPHHHLMVANHGLEMSRLPPLPGIDLM